MPLRADIRLSPPVEELFLNFFNFFSVRVCVECPMLIYMYTSGGRKLLLLLLQKVKK